MYTKISKKDSEIFPQLESPKLYSDIHKHQLSVFFVIQNLKLFAKMMLSLTRAIANMVNTGNHDVMIHLVTAQYDTK